MKKITASIFLGVLLLAFRVGAAATFTVTPSIVSNDYTGLITFQMNGLTNTERVLVEQFFDFNSNNVVDAGDLRVRAFRPRDGSAFAFGGVTNINVLKDRDGATNGAITAYYQFPFSPELARGNGRYVFRFSSPSTTSGSSNVPFTIASPPYTQMVTGAVKSGVTPLANALVALLMQDSSGNQQFIAGTAANASGNFALKAPVGNYQMIAVQSGYVADFATLPQVALTTNSTIPANVDLTLATRTLAGSLVDSTNTALTVEAGTQMFVQSSNNLFTIGFTDTNGNFSVPVTADFWKVEVSDKTAASFGDLVPQNKTKFNTVTNSVTNANVALERSTALIYGTVKDSLGVPIPGLVMFASDTTNNGFETSGFTDSNGVFSLAAVAGNWFMQVDNSSPQTTNYAFTSTDTLTLVDGQAAQVNIVGTLATARFRGQFLDNNGVPLGSYNLYAYDATGSNASNPRATTDSNGNFDMPMFGGSWQIQLGGFSGDGQGQSLIFPDLVINITNGVNRTNNIIAQLVTGQISGFVHNTNGSGIPNANVNATATNNSITYNVGSQTDGSGNYVFNVFNAAWNVGLDGGTLNNLGYNQVNNTNVPVPPTNATANFIVTPIAPPSITTTNPLPGGAVGVFYSVNLNATGGSPNYFWTNLSGPLPGGVSLDTFGYLSGTPTNAGTFCFLAQVTDQRSNSATSNLCITIQPACPVAVVTTALPDGAVGCGYVSALQANCGAPPYAWSLVFGSAPLPANLVLGTNGTVSGTPVTNGVFNFIAVVTDSLGATNTGTVQISINPAVQVTTSSLPDGTAGTGYNTTLSASGGAQPQTWSIVSGSLPPNFSLSTNSGQISGTTTNTGTFNFTARVSDPCTFADRALAITIYNSLSVATATLPKAYGGVFYSTTLLPGGGQPPYVWQMALGSGPLPSNLGLSSTGLISGPSAGAATNNFIVQVNDGGGRQATRGLSIITLARPVLDQSAPQASNQFRFRVTGAAGESYTFQFATKLTNWADLFSTNTVSNVFFVTDPTATNTNRVYRLKVNP
ncbi:MAG: carboxypeptidase regulatory-like domain-containing protein [Verrucomicrobia bacterium]|nr:carboxypeptidase regulatory-like domain-containing protein [Verrucomicrobiota bacterium]